MRILYVTTIGSTMGFFNDFIRNIMDQGHTVDIATNEEKRKVPDCYREWGCKVYPISTSRSPLNKGNLHAIKQIQALVETNQYDIVHCHTPIAAMCTRLACRKARKNGVKVLYTAHGFHFYKGAPLKNWLLYFPMEWICSFFTDMLITINQEDFVRAKKLLHARETVYVPGVGIDTEKFSVASEDRAESRAAIGMPEDGIMLLSVGELSKRKNQKTIIEAMGRLKEKNMYYYIAGVGGEETALRSLAASYGIENNVRFLGFRSDIPALCRAADIFCFPSLQEGLPVALMEAMASGLPCAVSKIRGNTDLIDENGGVFFNPHDVDEANYSIKNMLGSDWQKMGQYNCAKIQKFSKENVIKQMNAIYAEQTEDFRKNGV